MNHHPYASIFPMMEGAELQALADDIKANGLKVRILIDNQDRIIDGRNREAACKIAGVKPLYDSFPGDDAAILVECCSLNLVRRHLSTGQRGDVAASLEVLKHGGDRRSKKIQDADLHLEKPVATRSEAAKLMNVSVRTVANCQKARKDGIPEITRAIQEGSLSADKAARIASLPKPEQPSALERHLNKTPVVVDEPLPVEAAPVQQDAKERLRARAHGNQRPILIATDAINLLKSIYPDHPQRDEALRSVVSFILSNNPHLKGRV